MTDVVDKATRSRMMSGIKGKNTKPEIKVRKWFFGHGFRYRLHASGIPGKPDLIFRKYRIAIFVHGCFWHRHSGCKYAYMPKSNKTFWKRKFCANIARDKEVRIMLRKRGWRAFTVWECQIDERHLRRIGSEIGRLASMGRER